MYSHFWTKPMATRRVGWRKLFDFTHAEEPYRFETDTLEANRIMLVDVPYTHKITGEIFWVERHNLALRSEEDRIVYVTYRADKDGRVEREREFEDARAAVVYAVDLSTAAV
ncbi:hypothetical protein SEA_CECE_342 [Microbacterium phage Cece]|nr:hypothetical protein SEA_CECE_40 [Microbacterium phage Cece]UVG35348.1 hypothetical protein SEA_CECE_342 [Microbacterium phage Cece]